MALAARFFRSCALRTNSLRCSPAILCPTPGRRFMRVSAQNTPKDQQPPAGAEGRSDSKDVAPRRKSERSSALQRTDPDLLGMPVPFRRMSDYMMEMQREMDNMMNNFLGEDLLLPRWPLAVADRMRPGLLGEAANLSRLVPLDIEEDEHNYIISAEVPGFSKEDVKITMSPEGVITISGQKREEMSESTPASGEGKEGEPRSVTRSMTSRRMSTFTRSFRLPQDINTDANIKATTKDGVLHITVPKSAKPTPQLKEITVE